MRNLLKFSSLLILMFFLQTSSFAQAKINKRNLSKGEREALEDFEKRKKGEPAKAEDKTKDDSYLAKLQKKNAAKSDPAGRKWGFKHAISLQDKATKKRMKRHMKSAKKHKWH